MVSSLRNHQPVRLAYQPPANSTFLSEQTSHPQPGSSTFLSEQTSTSHQPPAKRTGCMSTLDPMHKKRWNCHCETTSFYVINEMLSICQIGENNEKIIITRRHYHREKRVSIDDFLCYENRVTPHQNSEQQFTHSTALTCAQDVELLPPYS
jgi:hypothetical protein